MKQYSYIITIFVGVGVILLSFVTVQTGYVLPVSAQEETADDNTSDEEAEEESTSEEEPDPESETEDESSEETSDEDENTDEEDSGDEESTSEEGIGDEEIEELKEKVASRVEELTETEYGTAGFVQKINNNTILLNTRTDDVEVIIDEDITEIFAVEKGSLREREVDDLEITDYVTVLGPKLEGTINANTILFDTSYTVRSGKIVEVNEDDFYISVVTLDKSTYTLDVEKDTTSEMYNIKTLQLEEIGFSKLKEGDTVHFTAPVGWREDQDRFSVGSLLIIPQEYFLK